MYVGTQHELPQVPLCHSKGSSKAWVLYQIVALHFLILELSNISSVHFTLNMYSNSCCVTAISKSRVTFHIDDKFNILRDVLRFLFVHYIFLRIMWDCSYSVMTNCF